MRWVRSDAGLAVRADIGNAQHVGRTGRAERHTGGHDDAVARLPKPSSTTIAAGAVDHVVEIVGSEETTQCRPQTTDRRRAVWMTGGERDDRHFPDVRARRAGRCCRTRCNRRLPAGGVFRRSGGPRARWRRAGCFRLGALGVDDAGVMRLALDGLGDRGHGVQRLRPDTGRKPTLPRA